MYDKYIKITQDAIAWLNKNEPEWQLEEPIDREAFIKDLLERAGCNIHWHEECKEIRDQVAVCIGIVDKEL